MKQVPATSVFAPALLRASLGDAVGKLDPRVLWHTPVMFVVEVGSVLTTVLAVRDPSAFSVSIAV